MGSSGGGGDGGAGMMAMMGQGTPMPGLPVAGRDSTIIDAYEYGQFQNFLPDIKAEGQNDMATGLRPDMFKYTKPNPSGGSGSTLGGDVDSQIQDLRDQLAKIQSGGGGAGAAAAPGMEGMLPVGFAGRGGVGTMGMGSGAPQGPIGGGGDPYNRQGWVQNNLMGVAGPAGGSHNFATDWRTKDAAGA